MDLGYERKEEQSVRSFDPEWEPKVKSAWMSKRKGRSEELDNRIRYLWAKVRVAV